MPAEIILPDHSEKPGHRRGRPLIGQAGEVDRRLLEAANELFLRQGFDATSCDQVAALAGAGKASIYARYASKDELFIAVVRHTADRSLAPSIDVPWHLPLNARLLAAGQSILSHSLRPEVIALMRVVMTMAPRMPDLARFANRIRRERGTARIAAVIAGHDNASPDALARALPLAVKFVDLVLVPTQMRALMGEDLAELATTVPTQLREALDLLVGSEWLKEYDPKTEIRVL